MFKPYWEIDLPKYTFTGIRYEPYQGCDCPDCTKKRGSVTIDVKVNLDGEKFHQQIDKVLQKLERAKLLKEEVFGNFK
jgi:hypothetical protein